MTPLDSQRNPGSGGAGPLSQRDRVDRALRRAGSEGLPATAFMLPEVIDEGRPIMRLASRIAELRAEGLSIETRRPRGSKVVRYYLVAERITSAPVEPAEPAQESMRLGASSPYNPWQDAA